ncbi:MAG: DUF4287 domain-containing protein [Rhodothermales bacterium]|nr:DUF4287 domain-containing protein [Rhodothermales bacterium]
MPWHPDYAEHPAIAYSASVISNMAERTGRSMEEWVTLALQDGPDGEKVCREWLRKSYGLGMTTASGIASFAHGDGGIWANADAYLKAAPGFIDHAYSGKKAHLRSIHDAVVRMAMAVSDEVRFCPTRTGLSIYRTRVIANLRPATQKRVDLGLSLRQSQTLPESDRLIDTGGKAKGDRITFRIELQDPSEVDSLVGVALKQAFEEDA